VGERLDIDGIFGVRRNGAECRLRPHRFQRIEHLVVGGRRGGRSILRIERKGEEVVATLARQRLDARGNGWVAVAHGPIDDDAVMGGERARDLLGLVPGDGEERGFVELLVPDRSVFRPASEWPLQEHDAIQDEPPQHAVDLDDAPVGEKFLKIAPHRPIGGRIGRAEIDEKDADTGCALGGGRRRALALGSETAG
jgi:hypothetical protein